MVMMMMCRPGSASALQSLDLPLPLPALRLRWELGEELEGEGSAGLAWLGAGWTGGERET